MFSCHTPLSPWRGFYYRAMSAGRLRRIVAMSPTSSTTANGSSPAWRWRPPTSDWTLFFLKHFKGDYELGIYAGALAWAVVPDFINGIVQTVLAPKIAPAYAAGKFNQLQKTYLKYAIPIGGAFTLFALSVAGWVIRVFLSSRFEASTNVYRILVLGTIFNTVFVPLPEALMNFVAPKRVTVYTAIGLIWVAIGGVLLIPLYGAIGAACVIPVRPCDRGHHHHGTSPPACPSRGSDRSRRIPHANGRASVTFIWYDKNHG